jgi:prepilin-type N-terminal cleavage/methylation domain-containing protein
MRNQRGFTLVELLIVIAIFVVIGVQVAKHMGWMHP